MYQNIICVLLGLIAFLASAPALADLPSLMSDKPLGRNDVQAKRLRSFESLQTGKLYVYDGTVLDYRFAGDGLKASMQLGNAWMYTSISYIGDHRVELNWRAGSGKLKLALDGASGYRLEYAWEF